MREPCQDLPPLESLLGSLFRKGCPWGLRLPICTVGLFGGVNSPGHRALGRCPKCHALVCPAAPARPPCSVALVPCFFLRFRGSMSAAWATSSNRQSGTRIWAAWSGQARGSWHPGGARGGSRGGLTAGRRPSGGTAGARAAPGAPGASAGRGVGPAGRDPLSAQASAARSNEGVGRAGTLLWRGGAGGGAVHLTRSRPARGLGVRGVGVCPAAGGLSVPQAAVWRPSRPCTVLLTYLLPSKPRHRHKVAL